MKFYVYEWFNIDTKEVFYVGKGIKNRYKNYKNRNKKFLQYYSSNRTSVRIVRYFENENEAYAYEKELTNYYRKNNECSCNIVDGGYGGYSKSWTKEAREYYSKNNIMKSEKQRERMRINNPMFNKEIALKSGAKHRKEVSINNNIYSSVKEAAKFENVCEKTISDWCKRGYNSNYEPCRYTAELQKEYKKRVTCSKACLIDGVLFPSLKEGANHIKGNSSSLLKAIKAKRKYKNHTVEYANQQPS